ncbi:CPCC family cysteine-rich protein [Crassaminicella profunda]|uniref:CPCC family cysteine-rich protein n=1 Tax=Crassaminicella profunda TaxID=1286698 RepID=UPI001CA677E9|nr:CPCC family cysteine-rich protein [Crassaminicella profunda]QZY56476.1 hypothetical protein K7H06_06000 [Crassaminicella profunda]
MRADREKCPCCGYYTIPKRTEEKFYSCGFICPVCFWEIDIFISDNEESSDQNHGLTLKQAKKNYRTFGACCKSDLKYVRKPTDAEK